MPPDSFFFCAIFILSNIHHSELKDILLKPVSYGANFLMSSYWRFSNFIFTTWVNFLFIGLWESAVIKLRILGLSGLLLIPEALVSLWGLKMWSIWTLRKAELSERCQRSTVTLEEWEVWEEKDGKNKEREWENEWQKSKKKRRE